DGHACDLARRGAAPGVRRGSGRSRDARRRAIRPAAHGVPHLRRDAAERAMIARYSRPQMAALFSEDARLATWLEVELAACEACEATGRVPAGTAKRIRERVRLDAARALAIEAEVHHDVIAFLSMVSESAGDDARHLHHGMTSSDLVDSALGLTLLRAGELLLAEIRALRTALVALAERHRRTVMVGRTHAVHAQPLTFGLNALSSATQTARAQARTEAALGE